MPSLSRQLPISSLPSQSYSWLSLELPGCMPISSCSSPSFCILADTWVARLYAQLIQTAAIFSFSSQSYLGISWIALALCPDYPDWCTSSHSLANHTWRPLNCPAVCPAYPDICPSSHSLDNPITGCLLSCPAVFPAYQDSHPSSHSLAHPIPLCVPLIAWLLAWLIKTATHLLIL